MMKMNRSRRRRALCCAIESLENRTLLAATPLLTGGGAARAGTGRPGGTPANTPATITTGAWPTYTQAVADLNTLASTYPSITKLVNIGTTVQGRTIYAMEITDNPNVNEDEPEF